MQLITDHYKRLNTELHAQRPGYGARGKNRKTKVLSLAERFNCAGVLDYGCGKGTLETALKGILTVVSYDPCVEAFCKDPEPQDLLVCTDVLEHIEEELLENVLTHIASKTKKVAWLRINTTPDTTKTLPDGTNPHRCLHAHKWWKEKLKNYFKYVSNKSKAKARHCDLICKRPLIKATKEDACLQEHH
jgi:2-polyprenyl-3-methyl-5-hydroxy-6-metoxy-1,4-benzoquinol methylase